MQVFICWSGTASHNVAKALMTFLEDTIQEVKPFLSSESIQKGGHWLNEISGQLSASNFGVLCLTKENLNSRWLLFEAGALSKDAAEGRVSALLIGVESSAVESPLSQFQNTRTDRNEVFKLLQSINSKLPESNRRSETKLARAFDKFWPDLEKALTEAASLKAVAAAPARDGDSIMKEVLELLRGLTRDFEAAKHGGQLWGDPKNPFAARAPFYSDVDFLKLKDLMTAGSTYSGSPPTSADSKKEILKALAKKKPGP